MRAFLLVFVALIVFALWPRRPDLVLPPDPLVDVAISALGAAQHPSFEADREFCGYLGYNDAGVLVASPLEAGERDGCTPDLPDNLTPVASLHTHGAYAADVPAEFPTTLDIDSDAAEGVNGFVSTPGGRLWYIDADAKAVVQICGPDCLPQDPDFVAGDDGWIARFYSYEELEFIENNH